MDINNERYETLRTAKDYIRKLIVGTYTVIQLFKTNQNAKALLLFPDIIDGLEWLTNAIELTVEIQSEKISAVNEIKEKLENLVEAFQNQDYLLVSDLMEYEISPVLEMWEKKLNKCFLN